MKKLLIPALLMLSGCSTVPTPITVKWPDVSAEFLSSCPDLKQTPPTAKLSDVLPVIVDNYKEYYGCQAKVDGWIEWYKAQKKISDSLE
jgi:hypothetical protein